MSREERKVSTAPELASAAANAGIATIIVTETLTGLRTLRLSPGKTVIGGGEGVALSFAPGEDGVQLSSDDAVENLELRTDTDRSALFNDTQVEHLGRLVLRNVHTVGAVRVLARAKVRSGHLEVENLDIVAADTRTYGERPKGYGVEVIPGAFVLWNQHPTAESRSPRILWASPRAAPARRSAAAASS